MNPLMIRRSSIAGVALGLLTLAPPIVSAAGINLSWDDCGTFGTELKTFACNSNTGTPFTLVGSFVPPANVTEFLGMSADLDITSANTLPDWWRYGITECRGSSNLNTNFDFTSGIRCADFYSGQAAGGFAYDVEFGGTNRALLRIQCAVPFDNRGPVETDTEYYAFKVNLLRGKTTSTGSCGGCSEPVIIRLQDIQLFQPPEAGFDPTISTPIARTIAYWNGTPSLGTSITGFSPPGGPAGTTVTITGENFTGATSVRFGVLDATYTIVSGSEIRATAPPNLSTGPITVSTPLGTATSSAVFYAPPIIRSFAPDHGPPQTLIMIRGSNFIGTSSVFVHDTATPFIVGSDSLVEALVLAGMTDGPITLTNPGGTAVSDSVFHVDSLPPPPEITSFTPTVGVAGTLVTILGRHFASAFSVQFGNPSEFTVESDSVVKATVPEQARTGPIQVYTVAGVATSTLLFYAEPVLRFFNPAQAPAGDSISINGFNFTGATEVNFNGLAASFHVESNELISATVPAAAQDGPITVIAPAGSATSTGIFHIGPRIAGGIDLAWDDCGTAGSELKTFACDVNSGPPFILIGSFQPPSGLTEFLGMAASLTLSTDGALPDWWKHGVAECRGTTGLSVNFDLTSGPFTCADFYAGQAVGGFAYDVGYGGIDRARLRIQCAVPFDNRGLLDPGSEYYAFKVNLLRTKTVGVASCAGCEVPLSIRLDEIQLFQPPELSYDPVLTTPLHSVVTNWQGTPGPRTRIAAFEPAGGSAGTVVTITGEHFTGTSAVRFNGLDATFIAQSDSVIRTTAPPGVRTGPIEVVTPLGTATSSKPFVVAPVIHSFQPAAAGAGRPVTIFGENFTGTTEVRFNLAIAAFTTLSDSVIHAAVPDSATDGPIVVTNIGGTAFSSASFHVLLPPSIVAFNPAAGGPGTLVTISGLGFTGASAVRFGGAEVPFTVASDSVITANLAIGARTGPITVVAPGGEVASDSVFIVAPVVQSFLPRQAPVATTITLLGFNFIGTSRVAFNGVDATFEVSSDALIRAVVPNGATDGPITVTNPGGSGVSDSLFHVGPILGGYLDLAWNDCGPAGSASATSSCSTNSGPPFTLVASFVPPPDVRELLGISAELRITASSPELPDWWKHGIGECRSTTGLSVNFDFTSGTFGCTDVWSGQAAGGFLYEVGFYGPATARMRIQCAIPFDQRGPVDPGTEYGAFKVNVLRTRSTGADKCEGCATPVAITLESLQLFQPPEAAFDPVLTTPLRRNTVTWEGGPADSFPMIVSFDPQSGTAGTVVTVVGSNFTGTTSVRFGSLAATFEVVSDSVIHTVAPQGVRSGRISIVTPLGTAISDQFFRVPSSGGAGMDLSWDDCGEIGSPNKVFACDTTGGEPFVLVASYAPPPGIDHFVGLAAQLDMTSATKSLPDWWRVGAGQCRGVSAINFSFDFTNGPFACVDVWGGQAVGGFAYDVGYASPNRARVRVQGAVPIDRAAPIDPGIEYYAFKLSIQRSKSTGADSCAGCSEPMCIVLNSIQLFQPPQAFNDPIITNPITRQFVTWQGSPLVTGCPSSTPVQVALVTTEVESDHVRLAWQVGEAEAATLYRRAALDPWSSLGRLLPDGSHRLEYLDRDVVPGGTYTYRLGIGGGDQEQFAGETTVTVPVPMTLALVSLGYEAGSATMSFVLPRSGNATIELYDLGGRRWAEQRLEGIEAGSHRVRITASSPLRPGVYFARLRHAGQSVSRRFVLYR